MSPILLLALLIVTRVIVACSSTVTTAEDVDAAEMSSQAASPCDGGFDDTMLVQTRMSDDLCLPAGVFNVDAPPLGPSGRRRDAMLTGSLCGAGAGLTTVRFRGDAHALYWLGIYLPAHAAVHDVTLMTCLSHTVEQTHLLHTGVNAPGVAIHDTVLIHPKSADGTSSGDCVNIVGSGTAPNAGMEVYHNVFQSCARVGVQISRGLNDAVISDNTFLGCDQDIGSEGGGVINRLTIRHNTFTSSLTAGYAFALERINGLVFDHNTVQGRPMFLYFVDDAELSYSTMQSSVPGSAVIRIGDSAHRIAMSNMEITGSVAGASALVIAAPLGADRQANLSDISIIASGLHQPAGQPFLFLQGVTGLSLSGSTLTYTGPISYAVTSIRAEPSYGTPPATAVPSTGITETANVHVGF